MHNGFLKTNDRLVNLKNVSNINILRSENKHRIIFNMNYNIEIYQHKQISDYVYWDSIDANDLEQNIGYLKLNKYFSDNFIKQINEKGFINKNEISSVKFSDKKNRVIFNLSHPVSFKDHKDQDIYKLTSEFVYVNCGTDSKYTEYGRYLQAVLN